MFDLSGKTALVTGSSRGIGRALAAALARSGAFVIVHGRTKSDSLMESVRMIKDTGADAAFVTGDTAVPEEITGIFDEIEEKYGGLDILVNNAATLSRIPVMDLSVTEWDRVMNTNARGYFLCAQRAAKRMIEKKSGRIINISSVSERDAAPSRMHYCASKAAIGMITKGFALELAPYGITSNAVLPGSIYTDFNSDVLSDPGYRSRCISSIPLGRLGMPEDIAGAVVMLASDEASFISGAEIVVDGAMTVY